MSKTAIPTVRRIAIWRAHKGRCSYCAEPVRFRELEIDHVVPESEAERLRAEDFRTSLGLTAEFQMNGYANLVPAHGHCSNRKRDSVMQGGRLRYFLELAAQHEPSAKRIEQALRLDQKKDEILHRLSIALDGGVLTFDDIRNQADGDGSIRLAEDLEFADDDRLADITKSEVERLLDRPVLIGKTKTIEGLEFEDSGGHSMLVRTCRERREAFRQGYFPMSNFALKMDGYLGRVDAVLAAIERAKIPLLSYIHDPHVGVPDLDLLPTSVLPVIGERDEQTIEDVSLGTLLQRGKIVITALSSSRIGFVWEECSGPGKDINVHVSIPDSPRAAAVPPEAA